MAPELILELASKTVELVVERIDGVPGEDAWPESFVRT